jgi:23S rRNA U2552 (ribose-2'-O)-methylase RlmE/FtsJ
MLHRVLLAAVLLVAACDTAFANWWIVRASDGTCLVVDIEPMEKDKGVTKIDKDVYQTPEQAEADVKRLCKEAKPGEPGNAE